MMNSLDERIHALVGNYKRKFGVDPTTLYIGLSDFNTLRQTKDYASYFQLNNPDQQRFMGLDIITVTRDHYLNIA